ncbi:MAG: gliding motility lipoprotein GldH [Bacteroidales bacterium]|jgi:gliding motility-associated lipoprotein GldH
MIRLRIPALVLIMGILLASCGQKDFYLRNVPVESGVWPADKFFRFEVPVRDTAGSYNIYLQIRNDGRYEYSNLWLFIRTNSPTGASLRDTVECRLADEQGHWQGRGSGGRYSLEIPLRYRVRFPNSGLYIFEIDQGMRDKQLKYITDLGLRIEKAG